MMLILIFAALCVAGVVFLFWELKNSDRVTADNLRASLAGEADPTGVRPEHAAASHRSAGVDP